MDSAATRDYRAPKKGIKGDQRSVCFRIVKGVLGLVINVFRIIKK